MEHMTGDVYRVGCDIERELNSANTIIRQQQFLDEENLRLKDRIKRLEEYINNLQNLGDSIVLGRTMFVQNAWTAAKEAKP
jgi:cell division septum initiation protein DivIVA